MNFRFLHAADLHLGSPLQGLAQKDEGVARRLASASRSAFEDLVTKALDENVAFTVIAGDIFDGDWKDASIGLFFNRQIARLDRRGVPTFFLRGNHDADSVVTKSLLWPDSVVEFSTRRPETHRIAKLEVALHGRGFPRRDVADNYAVDYPAPVPGWFNIGVLHTACGRAGHENYAPCTPADLAGRGYDYWALGHVHAFEIVSQDPWIVYPGNLQGPERQGMRREGRGDRRGGRRARGGCSAPIDRSRALGGGRGRCRRARRRARVSSTRSRRRCVRTLSGLRVGFWRCE